MTVNVLSGMDCIAISILSTLVIIVLADTNHAIIMIVKISIVVMRMMSGHPDGAVHITFRFAGIGHRVARLHTG